MQRSESETTRLIKAYIQRVSRRETQELNPYNLTEEDVLESDLPEDQKLVAIRSLKKHGDLTAIILWGGGPARAAAGKFCNKVDLVPRVKASSWLLATKEVISEEYKKATDKVVVIVATFATDSPALKKKVSLAKNKDIHIHYKPSTVGSL